MVDGDIEESQPGQAPAQQRHPAYSVSNRDVIVHQCDMDPLLDDVHQGA